MKTISVIITTKNDYDNLARCLDSLLWEQDSVKEVIVVDGDGSARVRRKCAVYPDYWKYVYAKGTNMCEGRNEGIMNATGSIIAFIDSDTEVCDGWAKALADSMHVSDIVAGYTMSPNREHRMNRVQCFVKGNDITWAGCNIAYTKLVIENVGLFDTTLKSADDLDYNLRCVETGFDILYCPAMKLIHYHRQSRVKYLKQQFWYGYGRYQFNKKHPGLKHETGSLANLVRLSFGALGYVFGRFILWK